MSKSELIETWKDRAKVPESLVKAGEEFFRRRIIASIRNGSLENIPEGKYDRKMFEITWSICKISCVFVLDYITKNDKQNYQNYFLVQGVNMEQFKQFHYLAVVQTKDGKWFAYSPSNYPLEEEFKENPDTINSFTTIFFGETFEDLMNAVQSKIGGTWANPKGSNTLKSKIYEYQIFILDEEHDANSSGDVRSYDWSNVNKNYEF